MRTLFLRKSYVILALLSFAGATQLGFSQEYTPFTRTYPSGDNFRYQNNIKGDLIFIANNIVNRDGGTSTTEPEDAYNNQNLRVNSNEPSNYYDNETGGFYNFNDFKDMQYIDVDSDTSTFSSSSASLNFPNVDCNLIRYAALYWSATYPSEQASQSLGTNRQNDFNSVKLKIPGGSYVDITADEVLYDGFTATDNQNRANSPYACYAEITNLMTPMADPTGEYTVANVRSVVGSLSGGAAGGWTLVIVYENPTLSGKLITTFDGFARVNSGNPNVDINYSGFKTIPAGYVNANIGAAALEGDFSITGDRLRIREKTTDPFTTINNGANPSNNFFNSNISSNGTVTTNRNPNSINTLGYDTDIFNLTNSGNSIIDNNATQATFRFTSNGDQYYPFFNSFNIEIIEPKIILEKRVTNLAETVDLTGSGVNLGDNLKYILSFENVGNDDATSYTIRDVLPQNITLNEAALATSGNLPPGVTYVYDATTRTIVFTIPDNLIIEGAPVETIRMEVKVAENCFDFVNACTNQIQNLAYSTYQGVDNDNVITDDPSVTDFDSCGFITPGATNFLLDDLSDCDFSRTVQLCGDNVNLNAGDNFDDYIWYRDVNENNVIDLGVDTVLNDGNPDGDLSTLTVTEPGIYIVDKIVADPCKGFQEIITVEFFGTTQTNPIIDFFNDRNSDADISNDIQGEILRCSIDGEYLANIFLCGSADTELIEINIPDAVSLEWQELNTSCTSTDPACPNKGNSCYSTIATGNAFTLTDSGDYRLVINYLNGCSSRYYFSAFKNDLPVDTTTRDIFCDTDGNITITNLGSGYGFQLINLDANSIQVPFSANNGNSFDIATAGNYRVDIRQLDSSGNPIANSCEFQSPEIGIRDRDFTVNLSTTPQNCYTLGIINIQTLNVRANYTYDLRFNDGTTHSYGTGTRVNLVTAQTSNNYTFENLNPDDYTVIVTTQDGCTSTQNITVTKVDDLRLTAALIANIGCTAGTITLTPEGGFPNPEYSYAIWSVNGTDLYSTLGDVPASEYTTDPIFKFGYRDTDDDGIDEYFAGEEGTYEFIVVDANNCFIESNAVTIEDLGGMTISINDDSPVTCSGNNDASITISTTNGIGPFEYSINGGTTTQDTPSFVGLGAGTYNIVVTDSSGCNITETHTITETATLTASAGVSRDVTCNPAGAEVRITNVVGGQAPYTYSFDGGTTFGTASTAILPPGNYNTVVVKDALGCEFAMDVYVEDAPVEPVITPVVDYNCDGTGNITLNSNISTYDYTYEIDGVLNSPDETSNIFSSIASGTYTIKTNYKSQTPPTPSLLLVENFGSGATTSSINTVGYTYEDQTGNAPGDSNSNINDYEYTVTSRLVSPFGSWINPIDHTTGTRTGNGRYLVINVGTPATGQVIYTKTINDIIPNQPLRVSLWILNLLKSTSSGLDPNLIIEIQETGTGTPVQTIRTGDIAKNTGGSDWTEFAADLNPGANTSLEFVIRTDKVGNDGNDLAIDDIEVYQIPEVCELFVENLVTVENDKAFEANYISSTNVTCFGGTDGTITFEVLNFDATDGFEYSTDGVNYTTSLVSPVTTPQVLGAGTATIDIRRVDDVTCIQQITRTITQPTAVNTTAVISTPYTCLNTGATITASASGGTPSYEYQLEDNLGNLISTYDFATNGTNKVFPDLTAGSYIVRARDIRGCDDPINSAIVVTEPTALTFTAAPSVCYTGASDGTITVTTTGGNGGLLFSINNGPFEAPTPTTASSYVFNNLASGTYIINVKDELGCTASPQNITIAPELSVTASASAITTCATSTDVTITATGGDANYVYAIVADGVTPIASDFATTNPIAIAAAGDYDVYVRDHAGATDFCFDMFDITIIKNAPIAITETLTDVTCFGGTDGAISLAVTGGNAPYRYSINNGTTYQTTTNFPNLSAGTYAVLVEDADLCTQPLSVVINEPNAITAEAVQTKDYTCLPSGEAEITVGSITPTAGGSGDYQYSINGGAWTASSTGGTVFTGLTDGTYSIDVRDAAAITCVFTLSDVIIDPLPIAPTSSSSVTYNCEGTGNITITPFDASYTYSIDGGTPQTGTTANVFNTIAAGNHTVEVNYGSECTTQIIVNVASGRAFTASISAPINITCFGESNGGFTINASNFGTGGFEYSLDGTTFVGPFTSTETVTGLTAQNYSITVRDVSSPTTCTIPLTQNLTQPNAITATASITTPFTCANTGATITAVANGGTPTYTYQLETNTGTISRAYQPTATFTNVPANASGENYVVRILDSRNCTNAVTPTVTVDAPVVPTFTATPTACYSGANDGTIQVDITSIPGNENFQFSINGGAWITPSPVSATTYTFTGLANGSYTIDVKDGFGCDAVQETVVLTPQLVVTTTVLDVSSCNPGSITVNATGGNGTLVYAIVPANTDPTGLYTTSNSLTVTNAMATANPAGYDVYVLDNNGVSSLCSYTEEDIIVNTAATLTISGTPTDPECYDGLGSIDALAAGGNMPYTYALTDLSPADGIDYSVSYSNINATTNAFSGIGVGDYEITITDVNGCSLTSAIITINNAVEITADIVPILPADCVGSSANDYGFEFQNLVTPTATLVEYSFDNGSNWNTNGVEQRSLASGTTVYPSIRVTLASGTICQKDFPRYIIPYPLDDLDISINAIVVDCNDLQVTVQGTAGSAPYEYAYSEDPSTFNPGTAIWVPGGTEDKSSGSTVTVPAGHGNYTWLGLTPGRTYVFYVRDNTGCVRQSLENVNELVAPLPIEITTDFSPTCFGASTGEITYTLNPITSNTHMRWEFYELGNSTPIEVSGGGAVAANILYNNTITLSNLPQGEYYIEVQQSDGTTDSCRGGSENVLVDELRELTATATPTRDISCNLPGLITVSGINGGGGAPYTYDVTGPAGFTAVIGLTSNPIQIPVNSPAGDYIVTLNDQYGCPLTLNTVTLGLTPNPTITVTQDNCAAPISLEAVGTSAAGNLRYAIVAAGDPMPTSYLDNNGLFTNVIPGSYDVYVIDGNGCTAVETAYIVNPVLSAKAELTKLLDCTGTPDATITIEALTGSGSYEYSISGATTVAQTTLTSPFVYDASAAGDYIITVYDTATPNSTTCNREFTVNVPLRIEPVISSFTSTPITCITNDDGTIYITALDNGTGPYTFEITSLDGTPQTIAPTSSTNTTAEFTGLVPTSTAAGYVVTITGDATTNACTTDSAAILIAEPTAVIVTIDPLVDVVQFTCTPSTNTDNNASITVNTVSGGSGTYVRYVFENTTTATIVQDGTNTIYTETNRAGGTYTISVYDENGCIGTATATIDAFDELLTIDTAISSAITCSPGNDGEVTITVTSTNSDTTKFEYSNDNGTSWQASSVFPNLGVGTHNFLVRHVDTDCELFTSINITDPNTFTIATPVTTDVICIGTATGTATFTVDDATYASGTYSWEVFNANTTTTGITGSSPNFTANALLAGDYYVTFSQDGVPTCDNRAPFSIAEPTNALAAGTPIASPITCVPGTDGVIEIIDVTGGWGGYAYYVSTTANPDPTDASNYVATPKFENLAAGTYEIWVIDSRGCSLQLADITLSLPTAITADLQLNNENCSNFEGEVQVINQTGGQGTNYSYQLQRFDGTAYVNLRPIQTNDTFSNLGAGQYQVIVSDQWGCLAPTANAITLYEEMVPLATVVKAIDCTVDPGGQITISQTGGNGPFNYTGTFPDGTPLTANTDGIFTALTLDGEYNFTITDGTCTVNVKQTLAPAVLPATPTIDAFTDVTCFNAADGTIAVSILTNGFDPYTFQITAMDGTTLTIPTDPTSSTATSAVFTGLANTIAAGYEITVTGTNSCMVTINQTIAQPAAALTVGMPTVSEFDCTTGNTTNYATIALTGLVTGGSGNYVRYVFVNDVTPGTPVQDGSNAEYTETNLAGGNYTITVYDDMGCSDITTATITPFVGISAPTVIIDDTVTCNGDDETITMGITITPATALPNLTYVVSSANGYGQTINSTNSSEQFTGLGIGNYTITITNNDTGCFVSTTHSVKDPKVIEVTAVKVTDETCLNDGVNGGSFNVTIANYTGGYDYQVFRADGTPYSGILSGNTGTALVVDDLPGGSYYVQIIETDATSTFCTDNSNAVTINAPEFPITAVVSEQSNVTCDGNRGSILVDPSGGKGPYTITIASATQTFTETGVQAHIFTGLSAGNFAVTITDAFGCVNDTYSQILVQPDPIVAAISADITLACYGDNTGFVTATVTSGGLGTLQYRLNTYDSTGTVIVTTSAAQTSNTFSGLFSGLYSISIADDVRCSTETPIATITDPVDVFGSLTMTQSITCVNDLELLLTANGGTAPYSFSTDGVSFTAFNNGNEHIFNTLASGNAGAGTYRYYVQDSFNCTSTLSNEIKAEPVAPITIVVDETAAIISCNGENTAQLIARASGGLGNYFYELLDTPASTTPLQGPNTNGIFRNLTAGNYYIKVTSEDCEEITTVITIDEPTPLVYTDDYSAIICAGDTNGYINVSLSGGSGDYLYAISPNLAKFEDTNSFTDLAPGIYTVIAQDKNGCFVQTVYTITAATPIVIDATPTGETCLGSNDGSIDLVLSGGTAPYSTRLENTSYVANMIRYTDLASGEHTVYVIDDLGCETNVQVTIAQGVNLKATVTPVYECTGDTPNNYLVVTHEDTSVEGLALYQLDDENSTDVRLEPDFTNIAPGNHTLIISLNGCLEIIPFTIENFDPLVLSLENNNINEITAIAAGGDGNYTFYFGDKNNEDDNTMYINESGTYTVTVVDGNGCEAIASIEMEFIDIEIPNFFTPNNDSQNDTWIPQNLEGFPNILMIIFDRYGREVYRLGANDPGWDGLYQDTELPTGDYWYIIKLQGENDEREFVGHFTLYR
ncbi:T9SS type B sorting domain-containing protein [Cellulophaga sp. E16_2]|uniref:T9SS type B sorting domain-containing protein n=1 Tax=Cellulophaga sp. E16_2 TaxID=2789297 RepID=UPI001A915E11|nr:T9SS type B sorting domain-containing protein [Cellulophaga sp. E16_2]MBO0591260.1 T9SS type B sorting domain-containing protein [Cellulophaga sp. E16_2]